MVSFPLLFRIDFDAIGDGRYCIFGYYSVLLHYQMRCLCLTKIFLLDSGDSTELSDEMSALDSKN